MTDRVFWEYLEELPEPEAEAAWCEWHHRLAEWHHFDTFHTHYLKVESKRADFLKCAAPCEHGCPRQVMEHSPSEITAVCPQKKATPIQLKFRDILIYSLRHEALHQAFCTALKILPTEYSVCDSGSTWHLGDYYAVSNKVYYPVYLTCRTAALTETINTLCQLCRKPFVLMTPTRRGLDPEAQQFLDGNNSLLLSMEAELSLQADGSFKSLRSISECMKSCNQPCPQRYQSGILPIEAYKYLVYKDL